MIPVQVMGLLLCTERWPLPGLGEGWVWDPNWEHWKLCHPNLLCFSGKGIWGGGDSTSLPEGNGDWVVTVRCDDKLGWGGDATLTFEKNHHLNGTNITWQTLL